MRKNTKDTTWTATTAILFATMIVVSVFVATIPGAIAQNPPKVVCVSWKGDENLPHPTWDGKEVTIKGTVRYEGEISYEWDFGDGSPHVIGTATTTDEYLYPISVRHTYTGATGTLYVAILTVTAGGMESSDTYRVQIFDQTLEVEADVAIDEGLWRLYKDQVREIRQGAECGYWEPVQASYRVAYTSASVQAFENNLHKPFGDPTKDPYVDCVRRGLNYLLSMANPVVIPHEDPYGGDTNGNGIGIECYDQETDGGRRQMYEVGMALMAIVSSDTPGRIAETGPENVSGRTYREIAQDMVDYCSWAQNDPIPVDGSIQGIYMYDLFTSTQTHITAGCNLEPDIAGDKIVWINDLYDGLYMYDLTNDTEIQICTYNSREPAISGNKIVWRDSRKDNDDIYMYDLTNDTEIQICVNQANQQRPAISGDKIVWMDMRNDNWDIYMFDQGSNTEMPICTDPATQHRPAISGDKIVWMDLRNGNGDIYMYDLNTGIEMPICNKTSYQVYPDVSGDKIVWMDWRNGNADIYMYNLTTEKEIPICTNSSDQHIPKIANDKIVWMDWRNGNADIYMYDLTNDTEIPICTDSANQYRPAISGDRIVWDVYYGDPNRVGGWRYEPNQATSDNSVTQWPIMGIVPAEAKWGVNVADFVKPRLQDWLNYSQCKEPEKWRYGGFGYKWPCGGVNIAKTAGTGIPGLLFCDVPADDERIQNATDFIDRRWDEDGEHWNSYYAMYAVMKAFSDEFLDLENTGTHNWWDEYARDLVDKQNADGSWPQGQWSEGSLATSWAIMILTRALYDIPPTAVAKANGFDKIEVDKDQIVHFDSSLSRDGTYHIVKYEWDWESDGIYDNSSMKAAHSYPDYGNSTVTLRVTDNRYVVTGGQKPNMTGIDTCLIVVHPPPHPPIADANGPYIGWVGTSVTLNGSGSKDPNEPPFGNDGIISWHWDLDNDGYFDDAAGQIVNYTWNETGIYPIALWVRANDEPQDCEEASRTIVEIGNHDPIANAGGTYKTRPCSPVTLNGSGSYDSDPGDYIVIYEWDLDNDGEYDDDIGEFSEFHSDVDGVYVVRLKVTDTHGATGNDFTTVSVTSGGTSAYINIKPETLNLASMGVFTAFIQLPEGYSIADIDVNTVECEGAPAVKGMIAGDTFIAKFNRHDLKDVTHGDEVELTVTGELFDGTIFEGSDMIRVIEKGGNK